MADESDAGDEQGVSADLFGLELGRLLKDLGEDFSHEQLSQIGGKIQGTQAALGKLQSDQIYNDNFEDEDEDNADFGADAAKSAEELLGADNHIKKADHYYQMGLSLMPALASQVSPAEELRRLLPTFESRAILNFTDVFSGPPPTKRRRLGQFKSQFLSRSEAAPLSVRASVRVRVPLHRFQQIDRSPAAHLSTIDSCLKDPSLAVEDWETFAASLHAGGPIGGGDMQYERSSATLESWEGAIRWKEDTPLPAVALVFDPNDPEMIFEEQVITPIGPSAPQLSTQGLSSRAARAAASLNPLNLSNDRFYEVPREHRHKVRQTLGQLVVQHAGPAIKLQLPFYKTRLAKSEVKSFHRPAMQFPVNIPINFGRVHSSRKKREDRGKVKKGKDASEILRSTRDLTLRDANPFVLYEYSEEFPLVLSNLGMGHVLVNYYRKKNAKDENIPKSEVGEPFVLDVSDESPFMGFGQVEAGQIQPTLYNNLVRAPLFKQKARAGDFLLIRHTTKNNVSYLLREIPHVFTVGQLFPAVQVPGPHARLATNMIKTRLQMIAHKLVQRSKGERIKIHRLMRYFPDQNELQMRQRLKEFMEYNRRAGDPDQGYWKLKANVVAPDEAEFLKQLPPEHMVLCESMQAGQQRLVDAGFNKSAEDGDDEDEGDNEIEQSLAPWAASKNFLSGSEKKARLALHGEGDPSGRGDAFSFIRVSMKEVFVAAGEGAEERKAAAEAEAMSKSGHKYNVAEQELIYKSEITRIWRQQLQSLSSPNPPRIHSQDLVPLQRAIKTYVAEAEAAKAAQTLEEHEEAYAGAKDDANKVLRIRRQREGKWYTEVVRDRGVIDAYMRHRHALQDAQTETEALVPTGDADLDAARRKRLAAEIGQLQKNQDRRLQRKQAKAAAEGTLSPFPKLHKASTKRVCGRCGQVGHMSTNTSCPLFGQSPTGTGTPTSLASGQASHSMNVGMSSTLIPGMHGPSAASPPADAPTGSMQNVAPPKLKLKLKR
ncbi:hypothetical protein K437DRAFT_242361 [Tilletiaria anomala UBC 951]|uniref:Transcription initiation factor TFIID subunit 1 histone acetyltransferase domain-containing protein n=1 Tax=Tilletiaria anomala (strain ATCC 24038 / CBS 436.72 / UBC 951) TaxID=1037660 RepID=A0A066WQL1_TILAU|nr:uncharacterized protein K437DRAFT_242361 [Tilletiaria anomala UBC 951]KDN53304.1 hypothetical protein K437DRAFT_242361 [Tilletiaria anomala UBC 951]